EGQRIGQSVLGQDECGTHRPLVVEHAVRGEVQVAVLAQAVRRDKLVQVVLTCLGPREQPFAGKEAGPAQELRVRAGPRRKRLPPASRPWCWLRGRIARRRPKCRVAEPKQTGAPYPARGPVLLDPGEQGPGRGVTDRECVPYLR